MRIAVPFSLFGIWLCLSTVLAAEAPDAPVLEAEDLRITAQDVTQALAARSPEELRAMLADPAPAQELARELIRLHEVEQRARTEALEDDSAVAWRLRKARQAVLQRALQARYIAQQEFPDFEQLARERYAASPQTYRESRRIRIAQIFIRAVAGDMATARRQAEDLHARIQAGESFAALARDHSDGPNAERGGEFADWLTRRTAPDNPVVTAAFALTEVGEITEVLESQAGAHIVQLIETEEARQRPFEEVKGSIINGLMSDYERKLEQDFQASLMPSGTVRIDAELFQRLIRDAVPDQTEDE